MTTLFPCIPIPKPRMTKSDRWKKRPIVQRYFSFRDEIQLIAQKERCSVGDELTLTFFLPVPMSWSKKKRAAMEGQPHQQKPDVDNLLKGFLDAVLLEDCKVWKVSAQKRWSNKPGILVTQPDL